MCFQENNKKDVKIVPTIVKVQKYKNYVKLKNSTNCVK